MAQHEVFRREGDDLEVVVRIPMTAAALGTEVTVATLEADLRGRRPGDAVASASPVPSGTQSGTRIAIDGKGVPRLRASGRGQLGVTLLVQTPTRIDDEQRELLRQLAELREETAARGAACRSTAAACSVGCGTRSPVSDRPAVPATSSSATPLPAIGATITLDGAEGRHAAVVRRIRPGEMIMIGDGAGAGVTRAGGVGRQVRSGRRGAPSSCPARSGRSGIVAVQALAKGDRSELAVEMLTELGVDEIVPWQAARSVVRWSGERAEKSLQRWRSTVREAAKQSRRLRVPAVDRTCSHRAAGGQDRRSRSCAGAARGRDRSRWPTVPLPAVGHGHDHHRPGGRHHRRRARRLRRRRRAGRCRSATACCAPRPPAWSPLAGLLLR